MKIKAFVFAGIVFLVGCTSQTKTPDISKIKVDITLERFDKDFFSMDTIDIEKGLRDLEMKYPTLYPVFINNILGLHDTTQEKGTLTFIRQTHFIANSVNTIFKNTNDLKKEFELAFRYVKYYFPDYKIPRIITIIGPVDLLAETSSGDLTPDFLGQDFLGISLQFYLGKDFSLYQDKYFVANVAPTYRSRRFDKKYLVADAMKIITDDIFPEQSKGKGLIEQMIEKGKQWWLLDKFLPATPDSIKTGYTQNQLDWSRVNEGLIWNSIITNEKNIYTTDPVAIQTYIGEGPFTQTMPSTSPGNIGQWVGWQIVKKFSEKNSSFGIEEVMKAEPIKILEEAKYKPK